MEHRSERLIFRAFGEEDFDLFYSVFSDGDVMRYTLMDACTSAEALRPYFQTVLQNNETTENRRTYEYAVYTASTGDFIGLADIEIHYNEKGGSGEIGYLLLPAHWGRGFATEIARTLLRICFSHLGLHRVCARCNGNNAQSEKIMQKTGMKKAGVFRKVRYKDGRWDDEIRYDILAEEWIQA